MRVQCRAAGGIASEMQKPACTGFPCISMISRLKFSLSAPLCNFRAPVNTAVCIQAVAGRSRPGAAFRPGVTFTAALQGETAIRPLVSAGKSSAIQAGCRLQPRAALHDALSARFREPRTDPADTKKGARALRMRVTFDRFRARRARSSWWR